ncbi:Cytochrome P450 [Rhynchospora pubera]|uniref:Cytochrome P450 n=1 Tax=Rhynchospora pubera TaxID=906938 RepID=A0AAV8BF85_9POAL|nr:Cytochrome P450 [Rhynchospora pubera]KAJ4741633.1 Cytochrome P450 [Rhynchospora pubera]KAJ4780785.1 Cytochrome P450 [Rhynchospora pubera]
MQYMFHQLASNPWSLFIGAFTLFLLWGAARALEWAWLRPRRLDRALRKQGLRGTVYRSLAGDINDNTRLNKEARAKPMPLSHDITPRVAPYLHRTMKEFGKNCFTWFGPYPSVNIMDPELVREILSNKFGHFQKQKIGRVGRLLADALSIHEGEKWAKHRRILNPAFHVEKLKRMLPAFSSCCDELVDKWENSVGPDGSFEIDVWPEMQNLTGDVISRAAFGSSYNEGRRIFQLQGEQAECFIKALPTLVIPFNWYLPTENNKRMKQTAREVRTLLMGIITKREKAIQSGEATRDDLLGLLLESNMREMGQNEKSNSSLGMTIDEVIEECKLFYFAGQETTSVLLTWTLVVLSMHPEWQEMAREEVLQHFGRQNPDFDGLSRLKIMSMILYEVLRLYSPVIVLSRQTYKTMQLGDITIPPGVLLGLPILLIHHDPVIWGPDATEFKPTRFSEGISKATKNGQQAFFPFGWGPRICIGQNFALLEAKMGLSMILQHFKFELSEKYQHAPYPVLTVHPQHGVPIKFRRL